MTELLVTYRFNSKANRDAFYAGLETIGMAALCQAEPGCIRYEYFMPCNADNTLFLLELWESPNAQLEHTKQPHFAKLGALKAQYGAQSIIQRLSVSPLEN